MSLDLLSKSEIDSKNNRLEFSGRATSTLKVKGYPDFSKGGVDFTGIVNGSVSGGTIESKEKSLIISNADEVILIVDIRTSYNNPGFKELCKRTIDNAVVKNHSVLKDAHIKDY